MLITGLPGVHSFHYFRKRLGEEVIGIKPAMELCRPFASDPSWTERAADGAVSRWLDRRVQTPYFVVPTTWKLDQTT